MGALQHQPTSREPPASRPDAEARKATPGTDGETVTSIGLVSVSLKNIHINQPNSANFIEHESLKDHQLAFTMVKQYTLTGYPPGNNLLEVTHTPIISRELMLNHLVDFLSLPKGSFQWLTATAKSLMYHHSPLTVNRQ